MPSADIAKQIISIYNFKECHGRNVHLRIDRSSTKSVGIEVFVGNIPWVATEDELLAFFVTSNPVSCAIMTSMTGKSHGFAIMVFGSQEDATNAIETYNGRMFGGRAIEVPTIYIDMYIYIY